MLSYICYAHNAIQLRFLLVWFVCFVCERRSEFSSVYLSLCCELFVLIFRCLSFVCIFTIFQFYSRKEHFGMCVQCVNGSFYPIRFYFFHVCLFVCLIYLLRRLCVNCVCVCYCDRKNVIPFRIVLFLFCECFLFSLSSIYSMEIYQLSISTTGTDWLVASKCGGIGTGRLLADCFFCGKFIHEGLVMRHIDGLSGNAMFFYEFTFRLNGKHPGFSTTGGALISKSAGGPFIPNTFSSLKHSVSIISYCHDIDTEPVLNFV